MMTQASPASHSNRFRPAELRSFAITGLFALAVVYTLSIARELLLPIVLALFLALLLTPLVRLLHRIHIRGILAPALVLLLLLAGISVAMYELWTPASEWVARAPQDLKKLDTKVRKLLHSLENVTRTAATVDQMTDVGPTSDTPQVAIKEPTVSELILGGAWHFTANLLITLVLAFFFLSTGGGLLRKLPRILPREHAERFLIIVHEAESQISRYLVSVTAINAILGLITAVIMALFGMPTPVLLGVVAAVLNFMPYIGPVIMAGLLGMVALITLPDVGQALLPPLAYLALHALEANFLTPLLLGRRLPLNPLAIFLGFMFWLWIWGVPGAVLSVPILVTVKVICDRTERLAVVGELLGR
ncbi:MAG: AI-2E family transporter [Gemmatimonadota bacterium]